MVEGGKTGRWLMVEKIGWWVMVTFTPGPHWVSAIIPHCIFSYLENTQIIQFKSTA